jgi:hypothetical protein
MVNEMRKLIFFSNILCLLLLMLMSSYVQASAWPQEVVAPEATIVVYQPQPEKLVGNILSGRAAISLELKDGSEPIFGAMWFTARLDTDKDSATAIVSDVKVENVTWPGSVDASEQRFTTMVEGSVPKSGFEISTERLSASLATAEVEQQSLQDLKTDPPRIVFTETLTVLMLFDGKPRFADIENSPYERALNTPFAVARNKKSGMVYLTSGAFWYQARDPLGPWTPTSSPPADLVQMVPETDSDQPAPSEPPAIMAVAEPTELIVTSGKPGWTSLTGGELLYVQNTETPWLRELSTNNMYVLLSGRWYRSKTQAGPWTFVRADELPASFSNIPPASDIGGLRTSVAGTSEADDALRDAAIPQTAAIKRDEATLTVEYDGKPKFDGIKGTTVKYAVNTASQVLEISGKYYAVDNAVWYTSASATGPWVVADSIPDEEIAKIPPSSPVYNTTYVKVYSSTPEVVYVGYTPGYMWSFPYYGVPVYGTGWYYPPYWGGIYYPRPPTWGFHVGYNPWTGWNFGVSWSNGFFSVGVRWGGGYHHHCCGGGWYGGGYRGGNNKININTGDINIGNNINIGNRNKIENRMADNNLRPGNRDNNNIYNRAENRARNASPATVQRDLQKARTATNRPNNLYADKSGAVARRNGNNWETRDTGSWKPAQNQGIASSRPVSQPSTRPSTMPSSRPSSRPASRPSIDRGDLNRSYNARQRGSSREMSNMNRGGGRRR